MPVGGTDKKLAAKARAAAMKRNEDHQLTKAAYVPGASRSLLLPGSGGRKSPDDEFAPGRVAKLWVGSFLCFAGKEERSPGRAAASTSGGACRSRGGDQGCVDRQLSTTPKCESMAMTSAFRETWWTPDFSRLIFEISFHSIYLRLCMVQFSREGRGFHACLCYFPTSWDHDEDVDELYNVLDFWRANSHASGAVSIRGGISMPTQELHHRKTMSRCLGFGAPALGTRGAQN